MREPNRRQMTPEQRARAAMAFRLVGIADIVLGVLLGVLGPNFIGGDSVIDAALLIAGTVLAVSGAGKPVGQGTIRGELCFLKTAIYHAVEWRRLKTHQVPRISLPEAPPPKPIWFFKDELERLFDAADGPLGDFCRIAYYTAGRRRSIETLTIFQVSLERNRIALDKPGAAITKKRRPIVPIVKQLRPTIEKCLQETPNEWLLGSDTDRLEPFNRLIRRAGLAMLPARDLRPAGKPTPHTLRHSRATHLLQDGVSQWAVSQLLGDRMDTVTRVYGHWCSDDLAQALENVGIG